MVEGLLHSYGLPGMLPQGRMAWRNAGDTTDMTETSAFHARLAFTMAAFHVLVQWYGLWPNTSGFVSLSIAELSL